MDACRWPESKEPISGGLYKWDEEKGGGGGGSNW